eukprot:2258121-Prorocentrum_lima.AAC.1
MIAALLRFVPGAMLALEHAYSQGSLVGPLPSLPDFSPGAPRPLVVRVRALPSHALEPLAWQAKGGAAWSLPL